MAARPLGPWYWQARKGYYVQIDGVRRCLAKGPRGGATKKAAAEAFGRLRAARYPEYRGSVRHLATVREVVDAWLRHVEAAQSPATHVERSKLLGTFVARVPGLLVAELAGAQVAAWLESRANWNATTRNHAAGVLLSALNWAAQRQLIAANPVAGFRKPAAHSRGRLTGVSPEQHRALLRYAERRGCKGFRDLLEALWDTGARPSELTGATGAEYRRDLGALVLLRGKNYARTGRPRVVYLGDALVRLVESKGPGPLFPNEDGRPFGVANLVRRFACARAALRLGAPVSAYSYRHAFATRWLLAGRPVGYLCRLLDTSPAMIHRHYGHLSEHHAAVRQALREFSGDGGPAPAPPEPH